MTRPPKRCVVIFGKTGHGKSSLANALFGLEGNNRRFNEEDSVTRVTLAPQAFTARVDNVTLRIIDTPGLFDQEKTTIHKRWPDVLEAIALGQPSIDAVIVVVDANQLYSGAIAVDLIQACIGSFICGRVIICFTKYVNSEKSKEDIIHEFNENLKKGVLGSFFVFYDKQADIASKNRAKTDILKYVGEIHERGFSPIEKSHFSEYTETYFKNVIKPLDGQLSLDGLRNSSTIKIELLEIFVSTAYMQSVITDHNETAAMLARQRTCILL